MNKAELAKVLKKSTVAIDGWLSRGCPAKSGPQDGKRSYEFDLADVVEWRLEHERAQTKAARVDVDLSEAKRRKAVAEASISEMDEKVRRGDLLERDTVDTAVMAAFSRVRTKLLAIPTKAAPLAVQAPSIAEIEAILRAHVIEALQELAETDVTEMERPAG